MGIYIDFKNTVQNRMIAFGCLNRFIGLVASKVGECSWGFCHVERDL